METICHSEDSAFSCALEGKQYKFAGVEVYIKAFKAETKMQWSLMEYHAPPGFKGPAPHYHKIMEEGILCIGRNCHIYFGGVQQKYLLDHFLKYRLTLCTHLATPQLNQPDSLYLWCRRFWRLLRSLITYDRSRQSMAAIRLDSLNRLVWKKYDAFSR